MSSTPEATVAAYFDALNRPDGEALTSLFDEQSVFIGERWLITHYMYNGASDRAGAQ
jgi:hypothetical protein